MLNASGSILAIYMGDAPHECISVLYIEKSIPHRFLKSFANCTIYITLGQLSSEVTKQGLNPSGCANTTSGLLRASEPHL